MLQRLKFNGAGYQPHAPAVYLELCSAERVHHMRVCWVAVFLPYVPRK